MTMIVTIVMVIMIVVMTMMKVIMKFEWRSDLRLRAAYQWNTYDRLQVCFSI
jgi:hypothetical protein